MHARLISRILIVARLAIARVKLQSKSKLSEGRFNLVNIVENPRRQQCGGAWARPPPAEVAALGPHDVLLGGHGPAPGRNSGHTWSRPLELVELYTELNAAREMESIDVSDHMFNPRNALRATQPREVPTFLSPHFGSLWLFHLRHHPC